MNFTALLAALALACVFVITAEARPKHRATTSVLEVVQDCSDPVMRPCETGGAGLRGLDQAALRGNWRHQAARGSAIIGSRPPGCPRAYCGCGDSLYLFGKIIPSLNLAANWSRKFPRALPAPGMVAARRGHVFVLVRHISGKTWLAHDSNSGRGKTRLHPRSIAGFQIVDPQGARVELELSR